MDGLDIEIMHLRSQLERTTALAQEIAAKRMADSIVLKGIARLLIPKCDDGIGAGVANVLDRTARDFRKHGPAGTMLGIAADSLEEWAADVRDIGPAVASADVQDLRHLFYELAAKHAATRIVMVGLAAYVGRADGKISEIAREVEQTVRDIRKAAGKDSLEAYVLIGEEVARIADELRKHE